MKVPAEQQARAGEPASARWLVFPRYEAGASTRLVRGSRAKAMVDLARNAFNFGVLGESGFHALTRLVRGCDCFDFSYSQLPEAIATFDALANQARVAPMACTPAVAESRDAAALERMTP